MSHVFPKWLYHKVLKPEGFICRSDAEFAGLGDGWVDSPAKFEVETMTSAEVQAAVDSGEAEIPAEATTEAVEPKRRGRHRKA